ncbi:MAG: hypothetical protein ACOC57_06425 [Acidobacteriota bacterium]
MLKKLTRYGTYSVLVAVLATSCARAPKVEPEPVEPEPTPPPVPRGFVMEPFQRSMSQEMQRSYYDADEIIIGVFMGIHEDEELGTIYYFSDFRQFEKDNLSWGPVQKVIMKVHPGKLNPQIIRKDEFNYLLDLDKVGICWDYYQGTRYVYLVEGKKNLIFLDFQFDELNQESLRNLIDAYPVTKECRAKDVFNLTVRNLIK